METRSWFTLALISLALTASAGCVTARKSPSNTAEPAAGAAQGPTEPARNGVVVSQEPMGPPEPFGPPTPEAPPVYGPEPMMIRPVVLVLGPGMARGFAHVGALRALSEAKIPVGAVLGTEMGALVGALYAADGNINRFEWRLLKFKNDLFVRPTGLLTGLFQKQQAELLGKRFQDELEKTFDGKDIAQMKVPLRVAIGQADSGAASVLERGETASAVRAAMAAPGLYPPAPWNGVDAGSAARSRPFLVTEARALALGPVVVIDVLGASDEAALPDAAELKDADLVIHPDMSGIGAADFHKRTEAAFRGKKAVRAHMSEIRHLVGLPPEDLSQPAEELKTQPEGGLHP